MLLFCMATLTVCMGQNGDSTFFSCSGSGVCTGDLCD